MSFIVILIWILVIIAVAGIVLWAIMRMPIPAPMAEPVRILVMAVTAIVVIVCLAYLLMHLLSFIPPPPAGRW